MWTETSVPKRRARSSLIHACSPLGRSGTRIRSQPRRLPVTPRKRGPPNSVVRPIRPSTFPPGEARNALGSFTRATRWRQRGSGGAVASALSGSGVAPGVPVASAGAAAARGGASSPAQPARATASSSGSARRMGRTVPRGSPG